MSNYDAFAHTFSESRKNHPWPEIDAILADIDRQGYQSIFDVGCGNGRLLEQRAREYHTSIDYLGIDSSIGMIEEARKLHATERFEVCAMEDIGSLSIESGRYDAILLLASYHHLDSATLRIQVLSELFPLLSCSGRIYMTNWNLLSQERYRESHRGGGDFDIKIGDHTRYYHGFTLSELSDIFSSVGCSIVSHEIFPGGRNILSILSH